MKIERKNHSDSAQRRGKNVILSNNARHKRGEIRSTTRQTAAENKLLSLLGSRSHMARVKIRDSTKAPEAI